ncbi:MAG TPA: hypothetical protein VGD37_12920 [Kofleriaceae bacterium]
MIGAVMVLDARRRGRARGRSAAGVGVGDRSAGDRAAGATTVPRGISDVDPGPLMQMGEAVDPDATRAAHEDVVAQRERLPVRGKNLP